MIVMKFGGTSVGNAERISNVVDIVRSYANKKPVVVVSAVGGITDKLIELAHGSSEGKGKKLFNSIKDTHCEILDKLGLDKSLLDKDIENLSNAVKEANGKNLDAKYLDLFQSFGEQMSSKIVAAQLNKIGIKAQAFNAWDLGFLTNDEFGNSEPLEKTFNNLNDNIKKLDVVPIITGFIGKTENGEITTLGRGGSDYSAGIVGSAIDADEIQIWTDVDGIMSADPKIVDGAKTLEQVSFAEASELAYFGARVLHPKTIAPAMQKNIPVKVLNTFNPKGAGTTILSRKSHENSRMVEAIAYKMDVTLINVAASRMLGQHGFLSKLFNIFDKYQKSIDVVSTSEVSVSLTIVNQEKIDKIVEEIRNIADVQIVKNKAIICVIGDGMRRTPGIAGRTFTALGKNKINIEMISQGASEINITFIVDSKDAEHTVQVLHEEYYGE